MRHLLLFSLLLLGTCWAAAQDSNQPARPTSEGAQHTVKGCLSGSDGAYTLTDKTGQNYQLTGDTAKLGDHVGHEIRVMGTVTSASVPPGGESPHGAMGPTSTAQQTIQVASFKHVSKTCENGPSSR